MKRIIAVLILLALMLSACTKAEPPTPTPAPTPLPTATPEPTEAPLPTPTPQSAADRQLTGGARFRYVLKSLEDNETEMLSLCKEYDLTLVKIWATWSTECIDELIKDNEIYNEYLNDTSGGRVNMIGIITDYQELDEANRIISENKLDFPMFKSSPMLEEELVLHFVPTTILVDSEGRMLDTFTTVKEKDEWISIIDQYLSGR